MTNVKEQAEVKSTSAKQAEVENVVKTAVETEVEETEVEETDNVFAQFFEEDDDNTKSSEKSREDIIKELLASGTCKLLKGLTIKNTTATQYETHAMITFVIKEFVIGDVRTGDLDAFGSQQVKLGKTHNVQTSSFAIAGVMKDNPKTAIFAQRLVADPNFACKLYAGGKLDVIMQMIPKGVEYVNPFASNSEPKVFENDKVIHHVIRLEMGEVGQDIYNAMLMKS